MAALTFRVVETHRAHTDRERYTCSRMWTEEDVNKAVENLLRPKRPFFDSDVVLSSPTEWGGRRGFLVGPVCSACHGDGRTGGYDRDPVWEDKAWTCSKCVSTGLEAARVSPHPREDDVASFERIGSLLYRAERCAHLAASRLAPWGRAPDEIVWRVGGLPRSGHAPEHPGLTLLFGWLRVACNDLLSATDPQALVKLLGNGVSGSAELYADVLLAWRYQEACARGMTVPTSFMQWGKKIDLSAHPLASMRLADLPNPIEPWLEIWSLGLALDVISEEHVILHCPRL